MFLSVVYYLIDIMIQTTQEGHLKNHDDPKNEDNLKNEDGLKNEDDL